jgi:Tfp pilus assembly protein PilO
MAKPPKSRLNQILVFSISFFVALILAYLFIGRLSFRYAERLKAEFEAKQARLQESQELIRSLPDPQRAIDDIEKKIREFNELGVTNKQMPRLIQLLGQAVGERNLNVISIRSREDIKSTDENLPAGVAKIYIEIVLLGSYREISEYVKSLSELPVSFNVEALSFEKKTTDTSEKQTRAGVKELEQKIQLQATLLLSTYMVWEL